MIKKTVALFAFLFWASLFSQTNTDNLKVFLDCRSCDNTYIRQNLYNVEFVRDQNFADVHLFFATQRNANGGRLYDVEFIGKNDFSEMYDKISFSSNTDMTRDDVRNLVLRQLKLGLVRFWMKKGTIEDVTVNVAAPTEEESTENADTDPWNYWVFRVGANGYFNGQEASTFSNFGFNLSARRVTEKNKFNFNIRFSENKSTFNFDDEEIIAVNNSKSLRVSDVISISDHWSTGAFARMGSSTFSNRDFFWNFKPAIEYNFFKYNESAKKQLTLGYRIGVVYNDYIERTVFGMEKETLWEHNLSLGGRINEKWGNLFAQIEFDQFLDDTTLNSLEFSLGMNIRLFKGFSFNINGNYEITRNQINLPAGDLSLEELLLQQQQLQSGYNYFISLGFSYSFGSIYNSIVNPRFNF
ncbi:MAG: hypothetical protein KJP09_01900 [Bacteroidia bacterium]|nr:hypothetical protein [Bacteroidia bacterium]NND10267.1 hypothetical protein [Flavobacteriaceae bacterium]NNK28870.1 hypothetical protein [Flavobacteriaceae bacterium]